MVEIIDHAYDRGWKKYGFNSLEFQVANVHGSSEPMSVAVAFHRGVGAPHISFGVVPPGTERQPIGMHVHRDVPTGDDVEEWYVIIDGHGEMTFSNGDVVDVGPGDLVTTYPGTGHSFRTTGAKPVRLVAIVPRMFTNAAPVDELPGSFKSSVEVTDIETATMNPVTATCRVCGRVWRKPADDTGSETLADWSRTHVCAGSDGRL